MARRKANIRRCGRSWIVYFRANGRQHFRSFADRDYGSDQASRDAAELYLTQSQAELVRGTFRPPTDRLFADFAAEWLQSHPSIDPRTRELYDQQIRDYLNPVLGDLKLSSITARVPPRRRRAAAPRASRRPDPPA
jgi:Phage integrase, N-terminal SAM-like domain